MEHCGKTQGRALWGGGTGRSLPLAAVGDCGILYKQEKNGRS